MNVTVIPIVIGALGQICRETEGLGSKRTGGDHPDNNITEIGQNTVRESRRRTDQSHNKRM